MTEVVGDAHAMVASFVATWLERAGDRVEASPEQHVQAMVDTACVNGVLRPVDGSVSDGFHTFDELYRHRMLLNAALFNTWAGWRLSGIDVHKSLLHHDGEQPFGGGWFIVVAQLPTGQVSWHYPLAHWDFFDVPVRSKAAPWDGHTSQQAADRLQAWLEG